MTITFLWGTFGARTWRLLLHGGPARRGKPHDLAGYEMEGMTGIEPA